MKYQYSGYDLAKRRILYIFCAVLAVAELLPVVSPLINAPDTDNLSND